ncbi:MAG TPA: hypothetical protein VIK91_25250 [Nannocystis sp.]
MRVAFRPCLSLLFSAVVAQGCSPIEPEPTNEALFQAAVEDASVPEADEIVTDLTAIRDDNPALIRDPDGRVLMATWTSWSGYDGMETQGMDLAVEVWVTVAPELQTKCRAFGLTEDALDLRLEQLLGLPPGDGKDRIVQLWVPPEGLFRPSPDPEIDDRSASLDFPPGTSEEHRAWIEDLRAASYGEDGYPWTQLGYTYDWSPDADSEVGLSEFVVRAGTRVIIESVTAQGDYCRP